MTVRGVLADELDIWKRFGPRFMADLRAKHPVLWRLSGLEEKYGPCQHFICNVEANEMVNEIAVFLMGAMLEDVEARRNRSGRGRPRDLMIPELAPNLLEYFLRFNNLSGRRSVVVMLDGKKKQEEAGPLFEFIKAAIEPLNKYLIENDRQPLSPARLARYALREHRCNSLRRTAANYSAGKADGQHDGNP